MKNPKSEIQMSKEARSPKSEWAAVVKLPSSLGFRISFGFVIRISDFHSSYDFNP